MFDVVDLRKRIAIAVLSAVVGVSLPWWTLRLARVLGPLEAE